MGKKQKSKNPKLEGFFWTERYSVLERKGGIRVTTMNVLFEVPNQFTSVPAFSDL